MLYCSFECGSTRSCGYAQFIATRMYIHFMCAYVYLHLRTFVCNCTYLLKCSFQIYQKSIVVFIGRYDSKQHDALKALSYGAIFLATCNAILLLRVAILSCFLKPNTISLRDYQLILCMLEYLNYRAKFAS